VKRFYERAGTRPEGEGWTVTLDDKPIRTPGKHPLVVPTAALAEAIAAEWAAQGETVEPAAMPLTQVANTAIDRVHPQRTAIVADAAAYAETDLLCHRADAPADLVARQAELWQPLLDWAGETLGATLVVTRGLLPVPQPQAALDAVRAEVEALDPWRLTAVRMITGQSGSILVALAVDRGRIDAAAADAVAHVDDDYQAGRWGRDAQAEARRRTVAAEIATAAHFAELARAE